MTELRVHVDSLRLRCGLDLFPWTDPEIVCNVTPVKALHVNELRGALAGAPPSRELGPHTKVPPP